MKSRCCLLLTTCIVLLSGCSMIDWMDTFFPDDKHHQSLHDCPPAPPHNGPRRLHWDDNLAGKLRKSMNRDQLENDSERYRQAVQARADRQFTDLEYR